MEFDFQSVTAHEAHEHLKAKRTSAEQLARESLKIAKELQPTLNSFITIVEEEAIDSAHAADKGRAREGDAAHPLAGVPYAAKDIFCTKGIRTTCGSHMLENYVPPYTAHAVNKIEQTGAVLVGKNNMDEFAMGASNETSAFGPVKNPWNPQYVPGGSSGGSAAAVASGQVVFALGTDTGGSIRQPAGMCGVVGLKPTYGRVSRYGVAAMCSSMDTVGPITKDVTDAALVLDTIAGRHDKDATTSPTPTGAYYDQLQQDAAGKTVGVWKEALEMEGLAPDVRDAFAAAVDVFRERGATIVDISLPTAVHSVATYYVLMPSEVSSNMARYDGIRYGMQSPDTEDLLDAYLKGRSKGFGQEVQRRIMLGTYVLSEGYHDAYYKKALKVRTKIIQEFNDVFKSVDAIVSPTSPTEAFKIGEKIQDPVAMYLADVFTAPANIAGIPAISVPCGMSSNGLPIGLQIMTQQFEEQALLNIAFEYEQATEWHTMKPDTEALTSTH